MFIIFTHVCPFARRLQEEYPQWFEKPVLEMVHHNTVSLDKLVEMAWVEILTKYAVCEECDFMVRRFLCVWVHWDSHYHNKLNRVDLLYNCGQFSVAC